MSNLLKNLLIALGLAVLLFLGYMLFFRTSEPLSGLSIEGTFSPEAELETQQLLAVLNELKSFNVEGSIFSDPLFISLQDFRVDIGSEPSGRQNPFTPIR
jgi:hypothetical protein